MIENAMIMKAELCFTDVSGRNGRNFVLELGLLTATGGCNVRFNPLRLPQLLQQLGLDNFSDLQGTYVQIPKTEIGDEVDGIKPILATDMEKWFKTENNIYFGSEFFTGYDDDD